MACCSSLIGSFTTSCMGMPLMLAGRGGSVVPKGVLGLAAEVAVARSYWVKPGGGTAVSASEEPAALRIGAATVGGVGNGVLLNDGNCEKAYCAPGVVSTGSPVKGVAMPCASKELPCG